MFDVFTALTLFLGNTKGILPIKTSASKPLWMVVNVIGKGGCCPNYYVDSKSFIL